MVDAGRHPAGHDQGGPRRADGRRQAFCHQRVEAAGLAVVVPGLDGGLAGAMAARLRRQSVRSGFAPGPFSPMPGENAVPDQNPYQMCSLKLHEGGHEPALKTFRISMSRVGGDCKRGFRGRKYRKSTNKKSGSVRIAVSPRSAHNEDQFFRI